MVWVGIKERETRKNATLYVFFGALSLAAYGVIPTLQPGSTFGRTFAVYGGFFILCSYIWGVVVQREGLDAGDYVGCAVSLAGVLIAWFYPR